MQEASADPLGQRTRVRLVERLRQLRRGASTRELAGHLGLHANGVRRHLEHLEEAGVLERRKARGERGRPRDEWFLAAGHGAGSSAPRRYDDLSRWLSRVIGAAPAGLEAIERTGHEIGLGLASEGGEGGASRFRDTLTALGFEPELEARPDGRVRCRLCNCPYLEAARESPSVVCTLHRGMTAGLLEAIEPGARLEAWDANDPDEAGCLAELAGTGWAPELAAGEGAALSGQRGAGGEPA